MESVKLGNVVNLDVVLDSIAEADDTSLETCRAMGFVNISHSVTGRTVSIVFTSDEVVTVVELQLFLQRQIVELSAKGKLPVNLFLADVEVLHIEEAWGTLAGASHFCKHRII